MHTKRNSFNILLAVLLCIATGMLVYIFFETKSEKNRKILAGIPKAYRNSKNNATAAIDSLLNLQGAIYVYTNDTGVSAKWAPNLSEMYTITYGGVKSLAAELEGEQDFIAHKDSLGYRLLLQAANKNIYAVNKGILMGGRDSAAVLWFFSYGSKTPAVDTVRPRLPARKSDYVNNWGAGISKDSTLFKKQLLNLPLLQANAFLLKPKNSYFYVVGYDSDNGKKNTDTVYFKSVIKQVNIILKKEGIDLQRFRLHYFPKITL
jgi:hypothetical protein